MPDPIARRRREIRKLLPIEELPTLVHEAGLFLLDDLITKVKELFGEHEETLAAGYEFE